MKRDAGDILDRFSIAILKAQRIDKEECHKECALFQKGYTELCNEKPTYSWHQWLEVFKAINGLMWDTEAELRKGHLDDNFYKAGKAAICTRKLNRIRVLCKNLVKGVKWVRPYVLAFRGRGGGGHK